MSQIQHQTRGRVFANVARGCLGNLVEWFDWFVYASFSLYFAASFFPSGDPTAQLLSTSVIFAVGFFMRPVGGWLLGHFADRRGRRAALTLSISLMSLGSLVIGLTPGYQTIGLGAPVLLVVARLVQGLSVGGEFGSSAAYLAEVATPGRRGFYSSFQYVSIVLGQLLALATLIVLQHSISTEALANWGWRIPFFIGAVLGLVVMYLRYSMEESEFYKQDMAATTKARNQGTEVRTGLYSLLTEYPRQLVAVFCLAIGGTVAFYAYTTYLQKYMVNTAGLSKDDATLVSFIALFLFMCLQPVMGAISDRVGRRKVMLFFSIGGLVGTVPIFTLLAHASSALIAFALMMTALVVLSGYTALAAVIKAELFPTKVRALGVGIPHALVAAAFGGTTETVALTFKSAGHEAAFFWYVTGCVGLTLVAVVLVRETMVRSELDTPVRGVARQPVAALPNGHARTAWMNHSSVLDARFIAADD